MPSHTGPHRYPSVGPCRFLPAQLHSLYRLFPRVSVSLAVALLAVSILAVSLLAVSLLACERDERASAPLPGGLFFGMSQDSFYQHCRRLNAEGLADAGRNNSVEMDLPDSIGIRAGRLALYPVFDSSGVTELRGSIFSKQFGGWTKELFADSLVDETLAYFESEYPGADFEEVSGVRPTYRRVDGHTLTIVQPSFGERVHWVMTDLRRVDERSSEAHRLRSGTVALHPLQRPTGAPAN